MKMDYTLIPLITVSVLLVTLILGSLRLAYVFSEIFIQNEEYLRICSEDGHDSSKAKNILLNVENYEKLANKIAKLLVLNIFSLLLILFSKYMEFF